MSDTLRAMGMATAIVVAAAVGLVGFVSFFSDLGPNETWVERALFLLICYAVCCLLFGVLIPQRWWGALLAAWGPVLIGLLGLVIMIKNGGPYAYWYYSAAVLVAVPGACLAFGYIGMRLRRMVSRPA